MFHDLFDQHSSSSHSQLIAIFEWIPVCVILCDSYGFIEHINTKSVQFFKANTKEDFIFDKQQLTNHVLDQARLKELIRSADKHREPQVSKIFFRLFDKSISGTEIHICPLPDTKDQFLILFFENTPQSEIYIKELSRSFKQEAQRLKPYLNKTGRELLDEITNTEAIQPLHTNKVSLQAHTNLVGEKRFELITSMFPKFSNKELTLCGYLSLKMSIDEIAGVTGNTPNALRVLYHRMLKKTDYVTSKEFIKTLENISINCRAES